MMASATRILAFGDSLTAGWTSFSSGPVSPFAPHLQKALADDHSIQADVTAVGQPGLAASQALHPLKRALHAHPNIDVCLLLLGANDLLGGGLDTKATDATISHLHSLHQTCHSSGAQTVAVGMLDHPMIASTSGGHTSLAAFNARIRAGAGADSFIDAQPLIAASSTSLWSEDRVHLVASGYAEFGRALATPLATILRQHKKHHTVDRHHNGSEKEGL